MFSTTDLATALGVANSTAVLWCDMYDRFALKPIERIGKIGARKLARGQLEMIKMCHEYSKTTGGVNSLEISVRTVLGNEEFLKEDLQEIFDAQKRIQAVPVAVVQHQSRTVSEAQPVHRAEVARSRGTVTQISKSERGLESLDYVEQMLETFQEQNQQHMALMQQSMLSFLEQIKRLVTLKDEVPVPRDNKELLELREKVEIAELKLRYRLALQRKARLKQENTTFGRWMNLISGWALHIAVIGVAVLSLLGLTILFYFLFAAIKQNQ